MENAVKVGNSISNRNDKIGQQQQQKPQIQTRPTRWDDINTVYLRDTSRQPPRHARRVLLPSSFAARTISQIDYIQPTGVVHFCLVARDQTQNRLDSVAYDSFDRFTMH